jgi:hypothetical protein
MVSVAAVLVSICALRFGIARPRIRRLPVLHTRAIVQPSGSMWPFRLRAWSRPCVCIRRHGAEILPMVSLRHLVEWTPRPEGQVRGSFAVPAFIKKRHAAAQQGDHWRQSGVEMTATLVRLSGDLFVDAEVLFDLEDSGWEFFRRRVLSPQRRAACHRNP